MRRESARLAVLEPLHLLRVFRVGRRLVLGVRDDRGRRAVITFRLRELVDVELAYFRACAWRDAGAQLAYVRGGRESALFDVDALFARALV